MLFKLARIYLISFETRIVVCGCAGTGRLEGRVKILMPSLGKNNCLNWDCTVSRVAYGMHVSHLFGGRSRVPFPKAIRCIIPLMNVEPLRKTPYTVV
jgi:hypothetical protein